MTTAQIQALEAAKLEYVRAEICKLEEETAFAHLEHNGLPSDPLAVRHLVYGRLLFMTLRLKEHVV